MFTSSAIAIIRLAFIAGAVSLFFVGGYLIDQALKEVRHAAAYGRRHLPGPAGLSRPARRHPLVQLPYAQYGLFVLLVPLFMVIHHMFTQHTLIAPPLGVRFPGGASVRGGATNRRRTAQRAQDVRRLRCPEVGAIFAAT